MKHINCFLVTLVILLFATIPLNAQTKVVKTNASKSTDYGVNYYLPKTVLIVDVDYSKITQKAGPYAKFADKLLDISNLSIIEEDRTYYTLDKINMTGKGVPDKNESYLIEFKAKTTSSFAYLTEEGLICTINADYTPEAESSKAKPKPAEKPISVNPQSIFSEEYINAGSAFKKAEIVAKQIYKLRESRNDLLTGEADNIPRDGEGIKLLLNNLEAQEKALVELFTGTSTVETLDSEFEIEPMTDINKEVIFRFSKYSGIVDEEDLSGNPVYINVKDLKVSDAKDVSDPKHKAKVGESIVYNIPGKAEVEVFFGVKSLYKNTFQVVQFGNKQLLATSLFEDKKVPVRVLFYPETGAIKQIIQ
jgi:hypothetical protein